MHRSQCHKHLAPESATVAVVDVPTLQGADLDRPRTVRRTHRPELSTQDVVPQARDEVTVQCVWRL